jgi:small subunit ribosomal protein S18
MVTKPRKKRSKDAGKRVRKKVCTFCTDKRVTIDYKEVAVLRAYMSDRAKIRARRVTGNCARHQREIALAIRNAREMALLPYLSR